MPSDPLILAYARPASGADAASDATVFTFASPPVRMQMGFIVTCLAACAVGAVVVVGLGVDAHFGGRRREDGTFIGCIIGLMVIAGIAMAVYRELKRLRRYGNQDVRLEIRDQKLLAWAPQQWGSEPRTVEIEEITSITAHSAGHVVGGVPIFQIHVRRVRWLTTYWAIRVAVADAGVIKRSVADLSAAVERARQAVERLPASPPGE